MSMSQIFGNFPEISGTMGAVAIFASLAWLFYRFYRKRNMTPTLVAETWAYYALSDLYFGFDTDEEEFRDQALFHEIMGLEKFLKSLLLLLEGDQYRHLDNQNAKKKVNSIAKALGHNIKDMVQKISEQTGKENIEKIRMTDFDGYSGEDLIKAIESGYMETRYPVPKPISDSFPVPDTTYTTDPLGSSGITKCVYCLCNFCFLELMKRIDVQDLLRDFKKSYGHRESFRRFNNLFWEAQCRVAI